MTDMQVSRKGDSLTIVVKLGSGRPSSSGKMNLLFSSGGFQTVTEDGLRVNLTIGKRA